jgi:hypothetical protein
VLSLLDFLIIDFQHNKQHDIEGDIGFNFQCNKDIDVNFQHGEGDINIRIHGFGAT